VLRNVEQRARAIASAEPFRTWPEEHLTALARAARVVSYRPGELLQAQGAKLDAITVVVSGSVQASAQNAAGRRYTFALVPGSAVYGLLPLVDGQEMPNDMIALTPVTALVIPFAAIREELSRQPALWESLAHEISLRARSNARQWTRLALDPLRARAAALLVAFAEAGGLTAGGGPLKLGVRLPQERLGEMLGVSRQTATALVRDLVDTGLIRWSYGRVSVVDLDGLRALAGPGEEDKG